GNGDCAERACMVVPDLAVYHAKSPPPQLATQVYQCDFRCIRDAAEHRFAVENSAYRHAVKSTDQMILIPDFNGVCVAECVQLDVGIAHLRRDPGAATFGAAIDDPRKILIHAHPECRTVECSAQAA